MIPTERFAAPVVSLLETVEIPELTVNRLVSGVEIRHRRTHAPALVRADLMVRAGVIWQDRPLLSRLTNLMLKEGILGKNSAQVAECLDQYGAYLYSGVEYEYAYLTLCTPRKHLAQTATLLRDMFYCPTFPEEELSILKAQNYQNWLLEKEKERTLASYRMNELVFGKDHPCGHRLTEADFDRVTTETVRDFHLRHYRPDHSVLIMTGDVQDADIELMDRLFGKELAQFPFHEGRKYVWPSPCPSGEKTAFVPKASSLQAAIQLTIPVAGKDHPDFVGLKVLNTVLGGYFGSRLMTVVREEKGYTYGIESTLTVFNDEAYIDIYTQTALAYVPDLTECIWQEMERLKHETVPDDELLRVRRYLSGEYARMLDGPFALANICQMSLEQGIEMRRFEYELDVMMKISAEEIRQLAQQYFVRERIYEVRAGGEC